MTVGHFAPPAYPKLLVGATNRLNGTAEWLPADMRIEDALVASSAIPGVFPWRTMTIGGRPVIVVDGGVVASQPLSNLALEGCGTIIACAVGYGGGAIAAPTNALDNALGSVTLLIHQCEKLEEAYVRAKLGERGVVHHIHPEVAFPVRGYNFTPPVVEQVVSESCERTVAWLTQHRDAITARHRRADESPDPLSWLRQPWPDED